MVKSFLSTASKKVTDVRGFIRDAAGGNSIKYVAEKGAKHMIYIPFQNVPVIEDGKEVISKQVIAISGGVHEWQSLEGKYKAIVCMKDVIRQDEATGILLNDGSCPFCDRVVDAWDVYRYRKELEEANCKLGGEERKKHLEKMTSTLADERKSKDARSYMYMLIIKFRSDGNSLVLGSDNLPEYDIKIMKMSSSRVEKMQQQLANSGTELPGSELMIEYPVTDDRRLQVSQSTTAPVFPNNMLTVRFPGLVPKINQDVSKFEWDGVEKSFQEWNGMSVAEAKSVTDTLFEKWDQYKREVQINPSVKYMEYISNTQVTEPALSVPGMVINHGFNAVPTVPNVPNVPNVPTIPDVNQVFNTELKI